MFFRGISTLSTSSGDKKALIATGLRLLAIRDDRNHFVRPGSRVDQVDEVAKTTFKESSPGRSTPLRQPQSVSSSGSPRGDENDGE
jgi:hypothetical protein